MPFDPLSYRDPKPSAALIRFLSPLNRHLALRAGMRVRTLALPADDLARLRAAVNRDSVAFVAPNHPEYLTDWLIDKEISARVSPLMAHWATHRVVNASPLAQAFFLRCNLIANAPGGGGREYSVRWAMRGHGVLLHPEGQPTGHGDHVAPLFPGVVEMACEAARRLRQAGDGRPVVIVPVVWKLVFERDVESGLRGELALIERAFALPDGNGESLEARLARLHAELLRVRQRALGLGEPDLVAAGNGYFAAQAAAIERIWEDLAPRYAGLERDFARAERVLLRAIREQPAATRARDRALLAELARLTGFAPEIYGGPRWTQESMAECLERLRTCLPLRGRRHAWHKALPRPVGMRVAHVRVPRPLPVEPIDPGPAGEAQRGALLAELRARLQASLDALNAELEPLVSRFARPNPMRA